LKILNTGSPQGCVLSPQLFTIYTDELRGTPGKTYIIKYADDSAIVSLISDEDESDYKKCIEYVTQWCKDKFLVLNTAKTKEIIFSNCRDSRSRNPIIVNGSEIEQVNQFKYLGVMLDSKITFQAHVNSIYRKMNQKMYFIRRLNQHKLSNKMKKMAFDAFVQPHLLYGSCAFISVLQEKDKRILMRNHKQAERFGIAKRKDAQEIMNRKMRRMAMKMISNEQHPLHSCFQMLPNGKRLNVPYCRTKRFQSTFVPSSIIAINDKSVCV
jgi:hypothetical protein